MSQAQPKMAVRRRPKPRTYGYSVSRLAGGISKSRTAPRLHWGLLPLTPSRVLAGVLLLAMAGVLVWFFVDARFYVYSADVQGNTLLSASDVYKASGLHALSIFYVDRAEVAARIRKAIPGVSAVYVDCRWPGRVSIRIREQDVQFVWLTKDGPFLVDGTGLVLKASSVVQAGWLSIRDLDNQSLKPGERVDRAALDTVSGLRNLLPEAKSFEYSKARGIQWVDGHGWRIYFGDDRDLARKVATLRALSHKILESGGSVEWIDLRFVDSPVYR